MTSGAHIRVHRDIRRAEQRSIDALRSFPTGIVTDALGRRGALGGISAVGEAPAEFCGSALTVWTVGGDNLGPWAAIALARPGDVIVIANGGASDASVFGDLAFGMARNAGIVAIVTDGLVRDVAGIGRVGLPVFATGLSPNSPFKKGPAEIGGPISIGGVVVHAGDVVRGDRDGVVAVPRDRVEAIIIEAAAIARKEAEIQAAIDAGATRPGWIDDVLAHQVEWLGKRDAAVE
jgi:4-hydroxy-4-methyl-2-oxoglutarate aldolase